MNKETAQIEEVGIKMPFGRNFLHQLRLFLSASALVSSLLFLYEFSQGKMDNNTLIATIIVFFSGLITGTINSEGIEKIHRDKPKNIFVRIKNIILIVLWVVGLVWGAVFIFTVLYVTFMIYFK